MTRIEPDSTPATMASSAENFRNPTWNSVSSWRSPRLRAMRPNSVAPPVPTTTPSPSPARTSVPISAQQLRSFSPVPAVTGAVLFSTGRDSPVSTDSSHSSPSVRKSRMSAGTIAPVSMRTRSPGTRSMTSHVVHSPSRRTNARCRTSEWSASTARAARNSFTNPSPMLNVTIVPMITASVPSPTK